MAFRDCLPAAEATHMCDPRAGCAGPGCAVEARLTMESRPTVEAAATVEPGEAMATGAKSETGEPAKRIAVAVIRPIIVTWRILGIVAGARGDTAVIRGKRVTGRADRDRYGGGG